MKTPKRLQSLVEEGLIDMVVREQRVFDAQIRRLWSSPEVTASIRGFVDQLRAG